MTKFRLKGAKHNRWPIRVMRTIVGQDNIPRQIKRKEHLMGGEIYDSVVLDVPYEELKKQLGANIVWSDEETTQDTKQTH